MNSTSMRPVCGTFSELGCELEPGDEGECPFVKRPEPDPDQQREMRQDMKRVWGDDFYD